MRKKRTLILGIQIVLLIVTVLAFMTYTKNEVKPHDAYVFSRNLSVNEEVTATDVKKISVPTSALTTDFALDPNEIVGKFVTTDVFADNYIYNAQLTDEGNIDPFKSMDLSKYRKISLPISYVDGFGGDIKRGDKVDLVFTGAGKSKDATGSETEFQYSKAFLQDVLVYSVTTDDGMAYVDRSTQTAEETTNGQSGSEITTQSSTGELAVVTIAVTLDQAEEITARMEQGKIRLVARFDQNQSYETLGFVLGEYSKVFSAPANAETGRATINQNK